MKKNGNKVSGDRRQLNQNFPTCNPQKDMDIVLISPTTLGRALCGQGH